jgi:hypothetical protein
MDEDFLRRKYLQEGLSTSQISKEISSARSTVVEYLKKYNIPIRPTDEAHKKRPGQVAFGRRVIKGKEVAFKKEIEQIEMIKGLRESGHSYHRIADILNTMKVPTKNKGSKWHGTTVMKILKTLSSDLEQKVMGERHEQKIGCSSK